MRARTPSVHTLPRLAAAALAAGLLASAAGAQGPITKFGNACAGDSGIVPTIDADVTPFSGQDFFIDITGPPSTPGFLIVGISDTTWSGFALPLDLGPFGLPGCDLNVSFQLQVDFTTDSNGSFRFTVPGPAEGITAFVQAYLADIGGSSLGGLSEGLGITGAGSPVAGDLLVTEIMNNPAFVPDMFGEWFEVYNPGDLGLNIEGWTLIDNIGSHLIDNGGLGVVVPAKGYLVLGRNGNPLLNGGIDVAYEYGDDIILNNETDGINLTEPGGATVDSVGYDNGATFPDPVGASMNLEPLLFDAAANDIGSNWCEGSVAIGGPQGNPDLATPGADNSSCQD